VYAMVTLHNAIKYIRQILIEFHVVVNTILVALNASNAVLDTNNTNGNAPLLTILMLAKSVIVLTIRRNAIMMKKSIKKG
jgi:hypothetical protein